MRVIFTILSASILLAACARGPMHVVREKRFHPEMFSFVSDRVVTLGGLTTDGDRLFFGSSDGTVYALKARTGAKIWKSDVKASVETPPVAGEDKLYVGTSAGTVHALSLANGKKVWDQVVPGGVSGRPGLIEKGQLVLFGANDGILYAFDTATGEVRWRYRSEFPDRIVIQGFSTPADEPGRVYVAFLDGSVAALRSTDGSEVWKETLPDRLRFPETVAPIVLTKNGLMASQYSGALRFFRKGGGTSWSVPGGGSYAAPLVDGDRVYAGTSDRKVVALSASTGDVIWSREAGPKANWSGFAIADGHLLGTTFDGLLYVFSASDGKVLWKYDFGASLPGPAVVTPQGVWVLSSSGSLVALSF